MNIASLVILALVLLGAVLALVKIRSGRRKCRPYCDGCALRDSCNGAKSGIPGRR